jgi:hypothetical protein
LRKSESGRIGSGARRSQRTKAAARTTPAVRSVSDAAEPQAIVVPPRLVKRTSPDSAPARSVALDAAELAHDRRERRRDDRLVERREQQDEQEGGEDQADALRLLDRGRHPRTLPRAWGTRRR